jgi:hypothetical protein
LQIFAFRLPRIGRGFIIETAISGKVGIGGGYYLGDLLL